jgi:hypothetical protein
MYKHLSAFADRTTEYDSWTTQLAAFRARADAWAKENAGRPPLPRTIVCGKCRLGPIDGVALKRIGPGMYVCEGCLRGRTRKGKGFKMNIGNVGNFITWAVNNGLTATQIASAASAFTGQTLPQKVNAQLAELTSLMNDTAGYNAEAPAILAVVEGYKGMPAGAFPLLATLRTFSNPKDMGETISLIENMVAQSVAS